MRNILITSVLCLTSANAAMNLRHQTFNALAGRRETLDKRQTEFCQGTCASCWDGGVPCITSSTCYIPSDGETCCSDGSYCSAGYYCTTLGCCPDGENCGGDRISTVAPPSSSSAPPQSSYNGDSTYSAGYTPSSSAPYEPSSSPYNDYSSTAQVDYSSTTDRYSPVGPTSTSYGLPTQSLTIPSHSASAPPPAGGAASKGEVGVLAVVAGVLGWLPLL